MKIDWNIQNVEHVISTGFVTKVNYRVNFSDTNAEGRTFSSSFSSSIEFNGDSSVTGFIPYDELELDDVITWVKDSMTAADIKTIIDYHQLMINNQIKNVEAPKTKTGIPPTAEERQRRIREVEQRRARLEEERARLEREEGELNID